MADDDVLIKIAADIGSAKDALATIVDLVTGFFEGLAESFTEAQAGADATAQSVDQLSQSVQGTGQAHDETKAKTNSFWTGYALGAEQSQALATAWGQTIAQMAEKGAAAITGAAKAFPEMVAKQADLGDSLTETSAKLGITVEAVSKLRDISSQSGVDVSALGRMVQDTGTMMAGTGEKSEKFAKGVKSVGLNVEELKAMKPEDAYLKITEAIQKSGDASQQNAKYMEVFGNKARASTGILRENISGLNKDFKDLDLELSGEFAKAGDDYKDNLDKINKVQEKFEASIALQVLKPVNALLEKVPELGGVFISTFKVLGSAAEAAWPILSQFIAQTMAAGGLPALKTAMLGLKTSLYEMAAAAWASLGPWLPLIATLALVGAAILNKLIGGWDGMLAIWAAVEPTLQAMWQLFKDLVVIVEHFAGIIIDKVVAGVNIAAQWLGDFLPKAITTRIDWFKTLWGWLEKIPLVGLYFKAWHFALEKIIGFISTTVGWLGKLWDMAVKFGKKFASDVGETADGIRVQAEMVTMAAEAQKKYDEAQDAAAKKTEEQVDGLTDLQRKTKEVTDAYGLMTDAQKADIDAALKANISVKDIAESLGTKLSPSLETTQKAIELYKDKLKETKKAHEDAQKAFEKTAFGKIAKEAKELATAIDDANKTGTPMAAILEASGKKAAELVQHASRIPGALEKIPPAVVAVGKAWLETDLGAKVKVVSDKVDDLTEKFQTKATAGAKAAADAVEDMQEQMTANVLTGTEARMAAIDREEQKALTAIQNKLDAENAAASEAIDKINKEFDARTKAEEKASADGKTISAERRALIEKDKNAAIAAVNNAVTVTRAGYQKQADAAISFYDQKRDIENKSTGDFEKDMALYGVTTQKVAQEHVDTEKKKLAKLKALNDPYYAAQIAAQQKVVDAAEDALDGQEKVLRDLGIATQKQADEHLRIETEKLQKLKALNDPFYAAQIRAQQEVVDAAKDATTAFGQEAAKRGLKTKEQLDGEVKKQKETLQFMLDNLGKFTPAAIAKQKEVVDAAEVGAGKMKVDWQGALSTLTDAFVKLAEVGGASFGGLMKSIGSAVAQTNLFTTSLMGKDGKGGIFGKGGMFGAEGGIGSIGKAFGDAKGEMGGFGGMLKGISGAVGQIGAMAGPIASAAVAAIDIGKKLWDAFTTSKGEAAAKQVGNQFGVTISEEAGNAIAKRAKDMFKGDTVAAAIYGMSDIVKQAGGVTADNFKKMLTPLRDVFTMVEKGAFTTEQATKVLNENFGAFAKVVVDSGKVASKEFTDIIALQGKFGTQSKEIADFVGSQTSRLGTSLSKLMSPISKNVDDLKKTREELDKVNAEIDKAAEKSKDDPEKFAELTKRHDELDAKVIELTTHLGASGESMGRFERLAVAGFNAALAGGVSFIDAIDQMGPSLDAISAANEAMGRTGGAAIQELLHFRDVATAHKEVVESAGALNEVMLALSNTGALNTETFKDLEAQGAETYGELIAAGFTNNESLQQMKGYLEQVQHAHEDLGLPIDENTQALLAQAQAAGIVKGEQMSMNDIMLEGLSAIIEALGGKIPAAFKTMQDAAKKTSDEQQKAAAATKKAYEDGVTPAVEETAKAAEDTDWDKYEEEAKKAAKAAVIEQDKLKGSVAGVQSGLAGTDWSGWADGAVEAAGRVQEAIDGVSLGHSPGGIKEIPFQLDRAMRAFKQFGGVGVASAEDVQAAIDAMSGRAVGVGAVGAFAAGAGAGAGAVTAGGTTINITIEGPTFWDDPNTIRPLVRAIGDSLMERLRQNRQLGL